jgi:pilus assembly protein CpaB
VSTGIEDTGAAGTGTDLAEVTTTGGPPDGAVLVTLALTAPDAEQLVWGMENGSVWLSAEPTDATEDGTRVVTAEEVLP